MRGIFIHNAIAVLALVFCAERASADVFEYYVSLSCDTQQQVAKIHPFLLSEGEPVPKGALPFSSLSKPYHVCSFGKNRDISITGGVWPDHPINNSITLYIRNRAFSYSIPPREWLTIKPSSDDYFIDITECVDEMACINGVNYDNLYFDCKQARRINGRACVDKKFMGASFDCTKAKPGLDKYICNTDSLVLTDATMASAFEQAKKHTLDVAALLKNQREWLRSRSSVCLKNVGHVEEAELPCVDALYKKRIAELKQITQQSGE